MQFLELIEFTALKDHFDLVSRQQSAYSLIPLQSSIELYGPKVEYALQSM